MQSLNANATVTSTTFYKQHQFKWLFLHWTKISDLQGVANTTTLQTTDSKITTALTQHIRHNLKYS